MVNPQARSWRGPGASLAALVGCSLLMAPQPQPAAAGGAFTFAGAVNGVDVITHPVGYTGASLQRGVLVVSVGASARANFSDGALQDIVDAMNTWNAQQWTVGNIRTGAATDVPVTAVDFESAMLHQLGHALGLADFNDAADFARAAPGPNGVLDRDAGPDATPGTLDDARGDDVNLMWSHDPANPFSAPPAWADAVSIWRLDEVFPTIGTREAAALLGDPAVPAETESVMIAGAFLGEDQRSLTAADVATLQLAQAGLDGFAGGPDDYVVQLAWMGEIDADRDTETVDIFIDVDPSVGFAQTLVQGVFLPTPAGGVGTHVALTDADILVSPDQPWFTGQPRDCNGNLVPDLQDIASGASADADRNGVPDECQCAGDLDGDGAVGPSDLFFLLARWGAPFGPTDLFTVLGAWGSCAAPAPSVVAPVAGASQRTQGARSLQGMPLGAAAVCRGAARNLHSVRSPKPQGDFTSGLLRKGR